MAVNSKVELLFQQLRLSPYKTAFAHFHKMALKGFMALYPFLLMLLCHILEATLAHFPEMEMK